MKNTKDKQFLQNFVQSIYLLASLKTENTRIEVYEDDKVLYQEIQFLYVEMKDKGESNKIYKILTHLIPYPLVILFEESDCFTIYTGRFERNSEDFLKLVNIYPSPVYQKRDLENVLQQLTLIDLPRQNFKTFYDGLRNEIISATAKLQYDENIGSITAEEKDQLDNLKKQIEDLRNSIKKENQLNRKIDMQMKLKNLKDELSSKLNQ
ncbi:DUF4391 domain-containing protein [Vagococcus hydrophili]|nr:DUF4391 domain-containing protein [Vagococcus hydrophili]